MKYGKNLRFPVFLPKELRSVIQSWYEKYCNILRCKQRFNDTYYRNKIENFKILTSKLLDVACCKCFDFKICFCEKDKKVPVAGRRFLFDQRNERRMVISGIDWPTTRKNISKLERLGKTNERAKAKYISIISS